MRHVSLIPILALLAVSAEPVQGQMTLVSTGSFWRYLDTGRELDAGWKSQSFDDSAWNAGAAPLGYGDGDEATVIGTIPRPITTYFRHEFVVPAALSISTLTMRFLCDDGAVVYLNGFEIARVRLPTGTIGPTTLATETVSGVDEDRYVQRGAWYGMPGTNLIAVELHQSKTGLDDARFDLEMIANIPISLPQVTLTAPTNGAIFHGGPVTLKTATSDTDGHVYYVQFYANGLSIANVYEEPFTLEWTPPDPGRYALFARAVDNSGRSSMSRTVHVQYGEDLTTQLTRGPYLQSGSMTSVVVRWRTDWFADTRVTFGTNVADLRSVMVDANPVIEHEAILAGLRPGTRYFYSIGSAEGLLAGGPDHSFVTAPATAKPTRLWAIGDFGTGSLSQRAVRDAYYDFTGVGSPGGRDTDVWLMLGDNAYESGTDDEYQRAVFEIYGQLLQRSAVWPTLGNHDAGSVGPENRFPYFDIFTLPRQGEAGGLPSGGEKYYSFDYGNIHLVCLDATSSDRAVGGPMLSWLEQDLAATEKDWIIAYWHQPPYSFGTHNSDGESDMIQMRENALPILEHHGVDLVLCGHSHVYERSYLLNGHYGFSPSLTSSMILNAGRGRDDDESTYQKAAGGLGALGGTVYVVCGCSGEGGSFPFRQHPAHAMNLSGFGSVVIDIDGLRLDAKFLRATGEIEDHFTMVKGLPAKGVRPALAISRLGGQAAIAWPTSLLPLHLESTEALGADLPWIPFQGFPFIVGRSNVVTVALEATNRAFRLRSGR